MHKDSLMKFRTQMRANSLNLSQEDSWFLSTLMAIPLAGHAVQSSQIQKVIELCKGHALLKSVQRIALVKRLGATNRLMLTAVANDPAIQNNMHTGYNCFVNAQGSLFSLRQETVRYYDVAQSVVDSFSKKGLPSQRSIARIAQMGLGGGLCSGVFAGDRLTGFIFLNGGFTQVDLESDATSYLLQALFLSFRPAFESAWLSSLYWQLTDRRPEVYIGKRLDIAELIQCIRQVSIEITGRSFEVTLGQNGLTSADAPLISHGDAGQILARALAALDTLESATMSTQIAGDDLIFTVQVDVNQVRTLRPQEALRLRTVIDEATRLGLTLENHGANKMDLRIPLDRASTDQNVNYSVSY